MHTLFFISYPSGVKSCVSLPSWSRFSSMTSLICSWRVILNFTLMLPCYCAQTMTKSPFLPIMVCWPSSFHPQKMRHLLIAARMKSIPTLPRIQVEGIKIERVKCCKYLGLIYWWALSLGWTHERKIRPLLFGMLLKSTYLLSTETKLCRKLVQPVLPLIKHCID